MTWRLHLSNQAIQRLDILPGKPTLLAAWTSRDRASYFELESGVPAGEHRHQAVSRQSDQWRDFLAGLVAPNGAHLPFVRTAQHAIYVTEDGRMRLFHAGGSELVVELENKDIRLETGKAETYTAVAFDRMLGMVATLDEKLRLTLYQQHIRVGTFDLGLRPGGDYPPTLAVARGGAVLFAADDRQLVTVDSGGQVKKRLETHYLIRRAVCAPNGKMVAVEDAETGVIRIYNGADLAPLYQRHALDLLAEASQLQLLADLPPVHAALGALTANDDGWLAFAIAGVICVTHIKQMNPLPRPQRLI